MMSSEARQLGARIASTQERYRVLAIRLITGRTCGLVVVDSETGVEQTLMGGEDWRRLQADPGRRR